MRKVVAVAVAAWVMNPIFAQAQEWQKVTMSQQLERNDQIRAQVEYRAGRVTVRSVDEGLLYRMNLRYDEDSFEPVADFSGDHLRLGVESLGRSMRLWNRQAGELELELARGIPMELDLEFGAVKADIDLGGLTLTDLDLSTGASESLITVSEPNPVPMGTASFEAGAAEFRLTQLGNLNAERIEVGAGVGSITLGFGGRWEQDASVSIDMGDSFDGTSHIPILNPSLFQLGITSSPCIRTTLALTSEMGMFLPRRKRPQAITLLDFSDVWEVISWEEG